MVSSEQSASSRFPRIISCFSWHFLHNSRLFFQELILPLCQSHRAHRYVALFNLLVTNGHWTDYANKSDTPRLFFPHLSPFGFVFMSYAALPLCMTVLTCCITGACTPPGCICCCRRICCWGWMMYWAPLGPRTNCRIWPETSKHSVWVHVVQI